MILTEKHTHAMHTNTWREFKKTRLKKVHN